jgi:hypothetical protein
MIKRRIGFGSDETIRWIEVKVGKVSIGQQHATESMPPGLSGNAGLSSQRSISVPNKAAPSRAQSQGHIYSGYRMYYVQDGWDGLEGEKRSGSVIHSSRDGSLEVLDDLRQVVSKAPAPGPDQ